MIYAIRAVALALAFLALVPVTASASIAATEVAATGVASVEATLVVDAPMLEDGEVPGEEEPLPGEEGSSWFKDHKVLVIVLGISAGVLLIGTTLLCCCCLGGGTSYYY
ncbi:MAG TPA: hypothetical protein QGF58_18945 [Myxococcota bacterium]|nr:hypothetical protein [Myxococcota bacterium]